MGEIQRTECLRSLKEIAIPLAERPARGDLTGEICHWADGYHLNVRLYEKLLLSVFDILDEGKLTEVSAYCPFSKRFKYPKACCSEVELFKSFCVLGALPSLCWLLNKSRKANTI